MKNVCLIVISVLMLVAIAAAQEVSLTIYNQDFALVKELRTLNVRRGVDTVYVTGVAATLDPTSVLVETKTKASGLEFGQQSFKYDLLSDVALLDWMTGTPVQVGTGPGEILEGELVSFSTVRPEHIILRTSDGQIKLVNYPSIISIASKVKEKALTNEPTLSWVVSSSTSQKSDVEISYLAENIGWSAEYVALLDQYGTSLVLSGRASLENRSGRSYDNARIKLVAGDLYFASRFGYRSAVVAMKVSVPSRDIEKHRPLFEYHLFALEEPITLAQNESKQLVLLSPTVVPVTKSYHYDIRQENNNVDVQVSFSNSKANSLGFPLPEGRARVYQRDIDGSRELLGEDQVDHTPSDEEVQIRVGSAFDIVGETEIVGSSGGFSGSDEREESYKCTLRNHKSEPVTIIATYEPEYYFRVPEVMESNSKYTRRGSKHDFAVNVPANGESELTFRVKTR